MYAVAGQWRLDPSQRAQQEEARTRIVDGVRQNPGFVRGFWSRDVDEQDVHVTYVVFQTRDQADTFKAAVEANAPAQSDAGVQRQQLRVLEVEADA